MRDDRRAETERCLCLLLWLTSPSSQLPAQIALAGNLSEGAWWSTALTWTYSSESWQSPSSSLPRLSGVWFRRRGGWGVGGGVRVSGGRGSGWVGDKLHRLRILENVAFSKMTSSEICPLCLGAGSSYFYLLTYSFFCFLIQFLLPLLPLLHCYESPLFSPSPALYFLLSLS